AAPVRASAVHGKLLRETPSTQVARRATPARRPGRAGHETHPRDGTLPIGPGPHSDSTFAAARGRLDRLPTLLTAFAARDYRHGGRIPEPASLPGAGTFTLSGTAFGFAFNPRGNRIRVGQSFLDDV